MMKISEMYRRSGGTHATKRCSECANLLEIKSAGKRATYRCRKYSEADGTPAEWQKQYPACAWFTDEPDKSGQVRTGSDRKKSDQCDGQMSFMDFPGFMS